MIKIDVGRRYKTVGGWNAFVYAIVENNPAGWCTDPLTGEEEPMMGIWDKNTGKCIKRGDNTDDYSIRPFDIVCEV